MKETPEEYRLQRDFAWFALFVFLFAAFGAVIHTYYLWQYDHGKMKPREPNPPLYWKGK